MAWLWYLALLAVQCFGLFFNLLGLPGLWLMVGAAAGYALVMGFDRYLGWPGLISILALAVVADVLEFVAGSAGAKAAGGSRRGMVGAIVGALVGGIFLTAL